MNYLILHKDRSQGMAVWWRPEGSGYTTDVQAAGRYSKEKADSIARIRGEDFPVPEDELGNAIKVRHVVNVEDDLNFAALKTFERLAPRRGSSNE